MLISFDFLGCFEEKVYFWKVILIISEKHKGIRFIILIIYFKIGRAFDEALPIFLTFLKKKIPYYFLTY